jgi:hypothetical protein
MLTDTVVRIDKQLVTGILFNATQNALVHGEADGIVTLQAAIVPADGADVLRVTVSNRPGDNHEKLLAAVRAGASTDIDMLRLETSSGGGLRGMGFGDSQSTYLGLNELCCFAKAFHPAAEIHLWVRPEGVVFELRVHATVIWPAAAALASEAPDSTASRERCS